MAHREVQSSPPSTDSRKRRHGGGLLLRRERDHQVHVVPSLSHASAPSHNNGGRGVVAHRIQSGEVILREAKSPFQKEFASVRDNEGWFLRRGIYVETP